MARPRHSSISVTDSGCQHDFLDISSDALEPEGQFRYVTISVRCSGCHVLFSWIGVNTGHPNSEVPVTSAEGYALRATIVARPGGVVSILQTAGLERHLVPPEACRHR